jgi:hypothetical protein
MTSGQHCQKRRHHDPSSAHAQMIANRSGSLIPGGYL